MRRALQWRWRVAALVVAVALAAAAATAAAAMGAATDEDADAEGLRPLAAAEDFDSTRTRAGFDDTDVGGVPPADQVVMQHRPPVADGAPPPYRVKDGKLFRVLVTGGAGFIGSHLVDRLLAEGHSVIVLDNLFTGLKSNLKQHFDNPRFEFIRHDITHPINLEVDQIYHLACPASPVHYKYNSVKTLKTSFLGTMQMLGLAKRINARFLLASTSEVYGDPLEHPQSETYWGNVNPIGERSCYDEGKRVAETLTMDYHRQESVDIRIARIFNTFGPRMVLHDGRVVSNFVMQAIRGQPMTVQGRGTQTRSFCYVSDMVDGLIRLMNTEDVTVPVNIGNPAEFTMLELADAVREVVDSTAKVEHVPMTPDDPRQRQPNITRAKQLLDWSPKVSLKEGLKYMADDFRARIHEGTSSF